jgi:excisionase family DNA binding protein
MKETKSKKEISRRSLSDLKDSIALKLEEAARSASVSTITLRRAIKEGNLKASRRIRHLLILRSELERWIAEGQQQ